MKWRPPAVPLAGRALVDSRNRPPVASKKLPVALLPPAPWLRRRTLRVPGGLASPRTYLTTSMGLGDAFQRQNLEPNAATGSAKARLTRQLRSDGGGLQARKLAVGSFVAASLSWTLPASADEPRQPTEPSVLNDTAVDLLDVADAFDFKDPFDVNLRLSFDQEHRTASVFRETAAADSGLNAGGYLDNKLPVATYSESTQRLVPEINIGLLRELALTLKLPIILANNRGLTELDGSTGTPEATEGFEGEQLFSPNFESPTRSGIEYFGVGLDLGIMSQFRNPAQPNWVLGIEGRFNVSEPMHACTSNPPPGQQECTHPADIDRDGMNDPLGPSYDATLDDGGNLADEPEGSFAGSRTPGVSRGTHAVGGHAYVSRRARSIEPYTGIAALVEFPASGSDYGTLDLTGALVDHPPLRGSVIAGIAVIPWEQPEKFSRVTLDFRVTGTYVSEGRDYSELFDALGSSSAPSIRNPNFEAYRANTLPNGELDPNTPSVVDPNSRRVYFTGLTDVQQHGDYRLQSKFTWQAGRYVKFDLSAAWRIIQGHYITFDQACNPNFFGTVAEAGSCKLNQAPPGQTPQWQPTGAPNPQYRRVLNDPGRRFRVATSHGYSLWLRANVLF